MNSNYSAYSLFEFDVTAGTVIIFYGVSYAGTMSAISEYDAEKGYHIPLVAARGKGFDALRYSYVALKDMTIVISAHDGAYAPIIMVSQPDSVSGDLAKSISKTATTLEEISRIVEKNSSDITVVAGLKDLTQDGELIEKQAINKNGSVLSNADYSVRRVRVNKGDIVYFKSVTHASLSAISEYNSEDLTYTALVVGKGGAAFTYADYAYVAEKDMTLAFCYVNAQSYLPTIVKSGGVSINGELLSLILENKDSIGEITSLLIDNPAIVAYEFSNNGEDFFAATKESESIEIVYWFKKCMANNLYTFYRVGYRNRTGMPSTDNIANDTSIVYINTTASDNIGPFSVKYNGSSYWIGGNHHYPNESAEKIYNTAQNQSYSIYVGGRQISAGDKGFANSISIVVHNILFDPSVAPGVNDDSLSVKMADEYVTYVIKNNTIEVGLSANFVDTTPCSINLYYGMQSMFASEELFLTPNGKFVDWEDAQGGAGSTAVQFSKIAYPKFNRFIEKSASQQAYQSTYLENFSIGSHNYINDSDFIFNRSYGKCYHHMLGSLPNGLAGQCVQWNGSYTFFHSAIADNDELLVYMGYSGGKKAIFVHAKKAFKGFVKVPFDLALSAISIVENTGFKDSFGGEEVAFSGNGIFLQCEKSASLIALVVVE